MQILRHLESQLKYIVIETEHLFPSGLHVTKATLQGLRSTISEISSTLFYVITVSTLRELVIVSAAIAGLISSFFRFLPFSLSVCFLFCPVFLLSIFYFFNFISCCCISFSLSCSFLLEGKVLQLCSNRNFGHLPVGWVSCLILGKEPN